MMIKQMNIILYLGIPLYMPFSVIMKYRYLADLMYRFYILECPKSVNSVFIVVIERNWVFLILVRIE